MRGKWRAWVADRFGLAPVRENFLKRRVPRDPWYFGDGATLLLLLMVQVVTGAVLALSYTPTPDAAYASVEQITDGQPFGRFLRGLHYWSAGLMVIMLFFHLFRQVLVGGYKFPREGTWLIGVGLFFAVLVMAFTGYVLRWDERAVHAVRVVLHMFYQVPVIGEALVYFVQGGPAIDGPTLTRFYGVHVIFIPLVLLALAAYHVYLVVLHGTTSPSERSRAIHSEQEQRTLYEQDSNSTERGECFYPHTAARSGRMAIVVFVLVLVLTLALGPPRLDAQANLVEPSFPVEEWWFAWYSALIAKLPPSLVPVVVVGLPLVLATLLMALPFVDRGPYRGFRRRPRAVLVVIACIVLLIYLTGLRRHSPWTAWPSADPPPVPAGFTLTEEAERGRQLFATFGCNTCHAVAGHGPRVATDLAALRRPMSHAELRGYIVRPPAGVPMPPYDGRLTEQQLDQLARFVLVAQTFPREQR